MGIELTLLSNEDIKSVDNSTDEQVGNGPERDVRCRKG